MAGPFGVDTSSLDNKTPTEVESHASSSATSSGDAAPTGEAFKTEGGSPTGDKEAPERATVQDQKEYGKEDLERMLGIETQAVNANQKFDDNFSFDLATLMKDPSQFQKFQQIYPAQYVERARQILLQNGVNPYAPAKTEAQSKANDPWSDPRIQKALEFADKYEAMQKEQRIASIGQKLDTSFDKLAQKYPDADKNVVNWYLQGLVQKGISLMDDKGNLRTQVLEKLFKADHDARNKAYEAKYQAKVKGQLEQNRRSKDMGSGGSLGSVQGTQHRTMKEATKALLNDIRASK